MIGYDREKFYSTLCGQVLPTYALGIDHERTCQACRAEQGRGNAPTLLAELQSLRDDLADRYDGAPDSPTLWMGAGLSALTQLLDGTGNREYILRLDLQKVAFSPQA